MKLIILVTCVTLCLNYFTQSASVDKSLNFLQKYGYLNKLPTNSKHSSLISEESYTDALKIFQKFYGLKVTGLADEETIQAMEKPRCGMKDINGHKEKRHKRYAFLNQNPWTKRHLTYRVSKYSNKYEPNYVDFTLKKAFEEWSKYTDFTFTQTRNKRADIDIQFVRGHHHGDESKFDGPGNKLAHAWTSNKIGHIHFDDDERWSFEDNTSMSFLETAMHEMGHVLGLDHSEVTAIMSPTISQLSKLQNDDIEGIQTLYGEKIQSTPRHGPGGRFGIYYYPKFNFPKYNFPEFNFPKFNLPYFRG